MSKLFSDRNRPVHMGRYPTEILKRSVRMPDLDELALWPDLSFQRPAGSTSLVPAMAEFQAMMDAVRDGPQNLAQSEIPDDLQERSNHLKAFAYFNDISMVGVAPLGQAERLTVPRRNPQIDRLSHALQTRQTKTLAAGIDIIMADLRESMTAKGLA